MPIRSSFHSFLLVVWCHLAAPCMAGDPAAPRRSEDAPTDVYVNDSFEASDALEKAISLSDRGRWGEAAATLQKAADAAGDRVIHAAPGYYVGLRYRIAEVISGWPEPGITAYRTFADGPLQEALDATADSRVVDDLMPIFERYFCTSGAAALADRIGQLAIEDGDFALAERVYRRVLDLHPDRPAYATRYRSKLLLVSALRGRAVTDEPADGPNATIRWMGKDRGVDEIITLLPGLFDSVLREAPSRDWPIFGGEAERNRSASTRVDELGLLWRYAGLTDPRAPSEKPNPDDPALDPGWSGSDPLFNPVVSGDLLFVQDFGAIVALRRPNGVEAWRHSFASATTDHDGWDDGAAGWHAATVAGGRVYASWTAGGAVRSADSNTPSASLICFDAATGRVLWRAEEQNPAEMLTDVDLDSSPIVEHGRVYVVGRRRRSFGFEDCYLYGFRASDGHLLFRSHLGSASTGTFGLRLSTTSIPCLHADTVYVGTNLGSVAAVSAHTGTIRWLRLYARDLTNTHDDSNWSVREVRPWAINPIIWSEGRIACLPTDSANVLILDAQDGRLQRTIGLDELGGVESLFGIRGDTLCAAGRVAVVYDLLAGTTRWSAPLSTETRVVGRGAWTDDELLIPTAAGLSRFRIADGQRRDVPWAPGERGGNLLPLPDGLLVGGENAVSAYVRKADIWRALRERMSAAPGDVQPALELAEAALRSGEPAEAMSAFREAIRRAEQSPEPPAADTRRRLYEDAMVFVDALGLSSLLDAGQIEHLYHAASMYSSDSQSQLSVRVRFAKLYEDRGQANQAIGLYQQILRDRTLRGVSMNAEETGAPRGAEIAEERIARLIARRGREVYSSQEAEARRLLETARAAGDEGSLRQVVEVYPNSEAAPKSLVAQAELCLKSNRPETAGKLLAKVYQRYPDRIDRPLVLRAIADAHERAGSTEQAYRWLSRAAREFPAALIEHQGRSLTFLEYRDRLSHVRAEVEPTRPHLVLPLHRSPDHNLEADAELLIPRFPALPSSRWSKYFVRVGTGILAFDSLSGTVAWSESAPSRPNAELLIATEELAVFATANEVFALDAASGERRWSHGQYPANLLDGADRGEEVQPFRSHDLEGDFLVSAREGGRISCLSIRNGQPLWSERHRPAPAGAVKLFYPWVVYDVVQDGRAVICLLDAATGSWSDGIITEERRAIEDIFAPLPGQIVLVTPQSMFSIDAETRASSWRSSFNGHLRRSSLLFDMDAAYLSDDGTHLRKLGLEDGRTLWESARLVQRAGNELSAARVGAALIVTTSSTVTAVDGVDGRTLWEGITPPRPRFLHHLLTDAYTVAVDIPPAEMRETNGAAYFYDHRNASGLIPREGGVLNLGRLSDVRAVLAVDGALLIQAGPAIHRWSSR